MGPQTFSPLLHLHLVGIGGIGMSALAHILLQQGIKVSGSDTSTLDSNINLLKLSQAGAKIYIDHKETNVESSVTALIYSSAIALSNPEIQEGVSRKIPILKRAELLAQLMRLKKGIAVAGTHGKTTTTGLLATLLYEANFSPSFVIGGVLKHLNAHALVGEGEYLVAEADESDGSFLNLFPIFSVVTNIDNDHLDFYESQSQLEEAFVRFLNKTPFFGKAIVCLDNAPLANLLPQVQAPLVAYGTTPNCHIYAEEIESLGEKGQQFTLWYSSKKIGKFVTPLFGKHNLLNTLAAIAVARELSISWEEIQRGLYKFQGMGRRQEILYKNKNKNQSQEQERNQQRLLVIEDYAHHPTEIEATLLGLREAYGEKNLVVFFQPHRYTRTKECWNQYLHCFNSANKVYLLPVYGAGEPKEESVSSVYLSRDINSLHPDLSEFLLEDSWKQVFQETMRTLSKLDCSSLLVVMGAGSIGKQVRDLLDNLTAI